MDSQSRKYHKSLAGYFESKARGISQDWTGAYKRGFSETVYHHLFAKEYSFSLELLCNYSFILNKIRHDLLESLMEDYTSFHSCASDDEIEKIDVWNAFFREKKHILTRGNRDWPVYKILHQLAIEHADDSPVTLQAEKWLAEGKCDWVWLKRTGGRPGKISVNNCLYIFEGHTFRIKGILVLSEGEILSWSVDNTLRIWDAWNGRCKNILKGHTKNINGACRLKNGEILSWSDDHTLRTWDCKSGQPVHTFRGHGDKVNGAVEVNDTTILSWSDDKLLKSWDIQTSICLSTLSGHTESIKNSILLSNGKILSWAYNPDYKQESSDNSLRLWDSHNGNLICILDGHTKAITGATEISGSRVVTWSKDCTLKIWDITRGELNYDLKGHRSSISGAMEAGDGRILSFSSDATIRFWDAKSGKILSTLVTYTPEGLHIGWMDLEARIIPGEQILSWSRDGVIRLWDQASGRLLQIFKAHSKSIINAIVISNDRILSWSHDNTLRLWSISTGTLLNTFAGHTSGIQGAIEILPDRILSWSDDATMRMWDLKTIARSESNPDDHTGRVGGVKILSGNRAVSWSQDETLHLWNTLAGSLLSVLEGHTSGINGADEISGNRILSWSMDKTIRIWDAENGHLANTLTGHTATVNGVLPLKSGQLLSWSDDKTIRLWSNVDFEQKSVFEGHEGKITGAMELKDGRILSWADDKTLRIWNIRDPGKVIVLENQNSDFEEVCELIDGRIFSRGRDGFLRFWDPGTGRMQNNFSGDSQAGKQMIFAFQQWTKIRDLRSKEEYLVQTAGTLGNSIEFGPKRYNDDLVYWHSECMISPVELDISGIILVTQVDFQVCIIQLFRGSTPITLRDLTEGPPAENGKGMVKSFYATKSTDLFPERKKFEPRMRTAQKSLNFHAEAKVGVYVDSQNSEKSKYYNLSWETILEQIANQRLNQDPVNVFNFSKTVINNIQIEDLLVKLLSVAETDIYIENIIGVCYLRLGYYSKALAVFAPLADLGVSGFKEGTRLVHVQNFLLSLLMLKREIAFNSVIKLLKEEEQRTEGIRQIIDAYGNWKKQVKSERKNIPIMKRIFGKNTQLTPGIETGFPPGAID
jgi:WD40 repeat protein